MSLGILHPPGEDDGRPFMDCPRLYFTDKFLSDPAVWWQVGLPPEEDAHAWLSTMSEWDDETHHLGISCGYHAVRYDKWDLYKGWFLWPKGTKITNEFEPPHIWLLTGLYFPLTQSTVYEGKWPD